MKREVFIRTESWPSIIPFRISNHVWIDFPCVVIEIQHDGVSGRGEALGVYYHNETPELMAQQLRDISELLVEGIDRRQLLDLLPPGGARFAADSALWDLETQLSGSNAWTLSGVGPAPVETVFTIGLEDTPEEMAAKAAVKILLPTLFLIFPALFVVVLGPATFDILELFDEMGLI